MFAGARECSILFYTSVSLLHVFGILVFVHRQRFILWHARPRARSVDTHCVYVSAVGWYDTRPASCVFFFVVIHRARSLACAPFIFPVNWRVSVCGCISCFRMHSVVPQSEFVLWFSCGEPSSAAFLRFCLLDVSMLCLGVL